ncbi:MAG: hypothetical protein PHW04_08130 [Candidatus Wallbacteria bacterium]|nr:hypothetical protein [Candidatus Wallbacteria bacterium]
MNLRLAIAAFATLLLAGNLYAAAPTVNGETVRDIFRITDEYCSARLAGPEAAEKEFFKFMLDTVRAKNAVHLAVQFDSGNVSFIEPQTGIHIMVLPRSFTVEDRNLADALSGLLAGFNRTFFNKGPQFRAVSADILIDAASWTNPSAPRNQINLEYSVKFVNKEGGEEETVNYHGIANMVEDKGDREELTLEQKIQKTEAKLADLKAQLVVVEASNGCSKEFAIRRLKKEIGDLEEYLRGLKNEKV